MATGREGIGIRLAGIIPTDFSSHRHSGFSLWQFGSVQLQYSSVFFNEVFPMYFILTEEKLFYIGDRSFL